jgi:hypothetical protein
MATKIASPYSPKDEQILMARLWSPDIRDDPLAFVLFVFPWGQKGTPLEKHPGPRRWQVKVLEKIRDSIRENRLLMELGDEPDLFKIAVASGRGIGKSTLVAWLNLWMMSCHLGSTSIVTANTEAQLTSKTWAELGKWHTLLINSHWFERTTLSLRPAAWFEELLKKQLKIDTAYYYAQALTGSKDNPDAFAGAHNEKGMLLLFDEASGIDAKIWSVSKGFFTEPSPYRFWLAFSNPRHNSGAFYDCFHAERKYWFRLHIDSRTVEGTDRKVLEEIVEKDGPDSYDARVEVRGLFPLQGEKQFISSELVDQARNRPVVRDDMAPLIIGVDPARFGSDATIIRFRKGRDARSIPPIALKSKDNMYVANFVAELIDKYDPDAVCIDSGAGTGIIDRLREMKYKIVEVQFGSGSLTEKWANRRTELWADMRDWLETGSSDGSQDLQGDLTAPEYDFKVGSDKKVLESKKDMKARGLPSPDHGDALAITFAAKPPRRDRHLARGKKRNIMARDVNYDIFAR